MKTRFFFLLTFLAVLVGTAQQHEARAANPITMQLGSPLALTEKPLSVQVRVGRWFPIAVTLNNTGDAVNATVSLNLLASGGSQSPTSEFYTEVELPQNSNKRVWLYGRVENEDIDGAVVNVRGRGISPIKGEFGLAKVDNSTRIVLTVSDSDEKLSYLSGLKGAFGVPDELTEGDPAMAGMNSNQSPNALRPLGAVHEMMPWKWIGLDTVDVLVLQDFPHSALRPEQLEALRGYVAGGGSLMVLGGSDWQRLAKSPLADLWPVTLTSSTTASTREVGDLVHNYVTVSRLNGADRLGGAPVLLTRGTLRPGARLRQGTTNSPVFATSNAGAGQVLYLAFDPTKPPFIGWSGNENLWVDVFGATSRPRRIDSIDPNATIPGSSPYGSSRYYNNGYNGYETNESNNPLLNMLQSLDAAQQLKTPPVSYIAWFLALYVFFLVPVNYCVLRYFDKRELAWVTVPVIVLVFSVISYAAALSIKGRAVLTRHVNLVQGAADSKLARADTVLWLFSPRKTTYQITSSDPQAIVADYINNEENARVTVREPNEAQPFRVENAAINMWDRRFFVGHSVIDTGKGVHVEVKGNTPTIQNNTPFDLRGTVLVVGGKVLGFGDIKAGATSRQLTYADSLNRIDPTLAGRIQNASSLEKIFPSTAANMTSEMAKAALPVVLGRNFGKQNSGALLIAWSDKPASALKAEGESPQQQDITVYVFRVNNDELMGLPAPGKTSEDKISKSVEATVRPVGIAPAESNPDMASGSTLTYNCELPIVSGDKGAQAWQSLSISARGKSGDLDSVYNSYNSYQWRRNRGQGQMSTPQRRNNGRQKSPVQLEVWDFEASGWRSLTDVASVQNNGREWSFRISLPNSNGPGLRISNLIRQPDNLLRVRARTAHAGIQLDTLRVQGVPR